ncbi:PH domain-containing protein [Arsukibacterium sp. UBA3155]|uniref:PH domain-containing protein n=1 Tax=Arsukibacterium sp. UBA3155 TaxID=1946058 RepID=UPI0025C07BCC|nr:PH domain-containing protein [Arsukibacterium sp. UBA3155]|tara:strand:- start:38500 stop:40146 length:1647 start_codon:yes stop_codon:yes gene_type:complete
MNNSNEPGVAIPSEPRTEQMPEEMSEHLPEKVSGISELEHADGQGQWQRVSPIAILYFAVAVLRFFIGQFVYLIPPFILLFNRIKDNPGFAAGLLSGLLLLIVVSAILKFYYFQYRLSAGTVEIRSGVISKKYLNLPFNRIQNIKLEQPIFYRPADYVCLQLDTAGSVQQEARLVALSRPFAETLKKHILVVHELTATVAKPADSDNSDDTKPAVVAETEQLLNQRSVRDLIIHGISNNRIWLFLGLAAPFYNQLADQILGFLLQVGIDLPALFDPAQQSWMVIGLYALSLTMFIMLLLTLFSVFGSVLSFYGYTLHKKQDNYIRRSGLLTRHEVSMRLSRLQRVAMKRDWLDMLLGRVNLSFEQINGQQQFATEQKIMVPSVTPGEASALLSNAYPDNQLSSIDFNSISRRFIWRNVVLFWLPAAIIGPVSLWLQQQPQLAALSVIPLAFWALLIVMRWYRYGYAQDDTYYYLRRGYFGVDYYCFAKYKLQQVQYKQSWLMRRPGLCTIKLITASGALEIPFVKEADGRALLEQGLLQMQRSKKAWM